MTKPFIPDVIIPKYRKVISQARKLPLFRQQKLTHIPMLDRIAPMNFHARFVVRERGTTEYQHMIIVYNSLEMLRIKRIDCASVYPHLKSSEFLGPEQVMYFIYKWFPGMMAWSPYTHTYLMAPYNLDEVRGVGIDKLIREHYAFEGYFDIMSYDEYQREVMA